MTVHIVGYEAGNIGSVIRAFRRIGVHAEVATDASALRKASRVLLPGVGGFAAAMRVLDAGGWFEAIREHAAAERPLLGICLGMQLLATHGEEGGRTAGLDLIPGKVEHLENVGCRLRLPHVGWNEVHHAERSALLEGIPDGADFYFAHSYVLIPESEQDVIGWVEHDVRFAGMAQRGTIAGIQCHPEKSSSYGHRVLANFSKA